MKAKCEDLAEKNPDTVILQLRGGFYNAFDESAVVLSAVMGYKLKPTGAGRMKCGFPFGSADKVTDELKKHHINYMFFDNDDVSGESEFDDNRFLDFCDRSLLLLIESERKSVNSSENIGKKNMPVKDSDYMDMIRFMDLICDGKDPVTGDSIDSLSFNDVGIVRMLFKIRDYVKQGI